MQKSADKQHRTRSILDDEIGLLFGYRSLTMVNTSGLQERA